MSGEFNAELHARPSTYFTGPAFVEHLAFMPTDDQGWHSAALTTARPTHVSAGVQTRVEFHTEFITVTRVTALATNAEHWPMPTLTAADAEREAGVSAARVIYRLAVLVRNDVPDDLLPYLTQYGFADTAASYIGGDAALICSDFHDSSDHGCRVLLFNRYLNSYRLGRMVRRLCEVETYRAMALLSLPQARKLGPELASYDRRLADLASRNRTVEPAGHKQLLNEISTLSAHLISAAAETRNRFGATAAYAKIVEERIGDLRETHVPGFQRFGVFVMRRFRPAVRTCEATALRLEQLSQAAMHILDLLQTRIQVEVEAQNAVQIQALAERAATQLKIQRAVEGLSVIAISYYLLSLMKTAMEAADHAGYHISPFVMLISIPIVICAVALAIFRVREAFEKE